MAHSAMFFCEGDEATKREYFQSHLQQLQTLKEAFTTSRKPTTAASTVRRLHDMCVGLDYLGDELFHPHCSFAHQDFVLFLLKERERRDGNFGFRIHAGELYNYKDKSFMDIHMGVVASNICTILEEYERIWAHTHPTSPKLKTDLPPPLRIGHGIGFLPFLNEDWKSVSTMIPKELTPLEKLRFTVRKALRKIHELRIPIEINLTSDRLLQGTEQHGTTANTAGVFNADTLYSFMKKRFCAIVCTDNDGIWSTELGGYSSVAAELLRACRGANGDAALQAHEVPRLLKNYKFAAFGSRFANQATEVDCNDVHNTDNSGMPETSTGT